MALPVNAQTNGERAIALGTEALGLYSAQKFNECAESFAKAHALAPSPVFQLYEARCFRGANRYLAAREQMRAVSETKLAEDAPGPWKQAVLDAKAELPQLEKRIPSIVVSTPGASGDGLILRVNGSAFPSTSPIELDPGTHEVTATFGAESRKATVVLKDGQKSEAVVLSFEAGKADPGTPATTSSGGPGIVPGAVLTAIGGGAVIAAAVFGGLALGKYGELEGCGVTEADELVCANGQIGDVDTFDSANLMADLSTGLFVAGGVTLAVGVVLMIALPGEEAKAALIPGGFRF